MPNWTDNTIEISGSVKDVNDFMDTITNKVTVDGEPEVIFNLTDCFPLPTEMKELHQGSREIDGVKCDAWYDDADGLRPLLDVTKNELIAKYGVYAPIDWQYRFWGTKWGDCDTELLSDTTSQGTRELVFTFQSAWGEPFMLLNDIANKYNLTIINTVRHEFEDDTVTTEYPWTPEETLDVYRDHRKVLDINKEILNKKTKESFNAEPL